MHGHPAHIPAGEVVLEAMGDGGDGAFTLVHGTIVFTVKLEGLKDNGIVRGEDEMSQVVLADILKIPNRSGVAEFWLLFPAETTKKPLFLLVGHLRNNNPPKVDFGFSSVFFRGIISPVSADQRGQTLMLD